MSDELIVFLRTHRKQAGLTQKELAAAISVSRKTINTIENGVFVPSTILSLRLAHVLGVEVAQLFALADPPESLDLSSD
ncbi:putative transcriptional regulator [Litoreibacter ponti]|uniref:Putative transcriptional regulator n=1 Tax=Litoreibacter ponti TaxID=1510457 RepID=A0A2T6BMN6_9RHOB|nr:helix-turn-helix transcriptional regulator [Litoreibacter ponti]PTX57325.1 putative transcriptional regulator [Litoreibacter ponti]